MSFCNKCEIGNQSLIDGRVVCDTCGTRKEEAVNDAFDKLRGLLRNWHIFRDRTRALKALAELYDDAKG